MPVQTITTIAGVAKQTARGTIATNPAFEHSLTGGAPIIVDPSQAPLDVTAAKRTQFNIYRDGVKNGSAIQSLAYMKVLGLYLFGALGADTVTGTGPYVHAFSTADLAYLTMFTKGLGAAIEGIRDCKVEELTLKWDGSKPLELSVKLQGTVFSYPATFTATTSEVGSEAFLIPVGGTFQYDPIGSSMASAAIVGGELTIKNSLEAVQPSANIEASDQWETVQEHSLKLTIIPDDLADFKKTVTGSASGTAAAAAVPVGSVSLQFKENNGGTGGLLVTGSKVAFLTAFPEANAKGGPVKIEMAGIAVMPSGGTCPLVYTLTNSQATY